MMNVALVGYGYWGPKLARNFSASKTAQLLSICDNRPGVLDDVPLMYPQVDTTGDFKALLTREDIHAVALATPVDTHYALAKEALLAGKHVWVEKPMAESSAQCQELVELAESRGLLLHVDHTFIYTAPVRKLRQLIEAGDLGKLYYYDSVRVNLGLFQHDVNVLWDLAVHDLSIMDYLIDEKPVRVSATGVRSVPEQPESIGYLTCFFDSGFIAHVHANWLAPVKVRQTLIGGQKKMAIFDDLDPSEKIKIYDKGIDLVTDPDDVARLLVDYRSGDMYAPHLDPAEALAVEVEHFVDCAEQGKATLTDGRMGLRVVKILEAATTSMQQGGQPVTL